MIAKKSTHDKTTMLSWDVQKSVGIDLFINNFSPSGTQPQHRKLAHEL